MFVPVLCVAIKMINLESPLRLHRRGEAALAVEIGIDRSQDDAGAHAARPRRARSRSDDRHGGPWHARRRPRAEGGSGGYGLTNVLCHAYPAAATVPLAETLRTVRHLLDSGTAPADVSWVVDR